MKSFLSSVQILLRAFTYLYFSPKLLHFELQWPRSPKLHFLHPNIQNIAEMP